MTRSPRRAGTIAAPLLLGCALAVSATDATGVEPLRPDQIRQNLFAACLPSDRVGWVVGELGRILRTNDGGRTWMRQDAGVKKPLLAISCVDTKTAWIGGKSGILYRTSNGGRSWEPLDTKTSKHIFDIDFRDPSHGVAVGDWGLLMYTDDGGLGWTRVRLPKDFVLSPLAEDIGLEPDDIILYALARPDDRHGWTVGEFGTIMVTDDGGRTWQQQRSPVDTTLFGVHFEDPTRGWAVGTDAAILKTTDGGTTWRKVKSPVRQRAFYDVALNGRHGWIAGDAGTLLKTPDRGRTWLVEPLPIELAVNWFRTVQLLPGGRGIVAGANGLLFRIEKDAVSDLRRLRSRGTNEPQPAASRDAS
jgi:photosystem II stability/assembly factor-like uncharacterized protein